ncbi:Thiol:disulfide interchange protein DsbA [Pseudoalteromonas holothuriae]|uniref:Thiol:disulfide interchange protein n=1 Tax=Pseudoalteromonas holothuriae TaxID=2963714 RepID=A0A9W4VVJ3_9GAMM|nr:MULTISPECIES: thiol:disulfide interchange protein DsbA/DsbL [unclassified Pseudoalteromonas]CAH9066473.1 Thiol:disulfide interchange protein DsbA [Pseudoalteromonas sp. CIP111854]CAH9067531.1 Thiol:disulfide interchange protein DsbA [Pseudoalteromonas sp. CIP111951]
MFKTIKQSFLLLCIAMLAFAVNAADFTDGKHYQTIENDKSETPKVTEFFSFYCPHCYQFEPIAMALEESLPKGAEFEKSHVNFLQGLPAQVQSNLSYAYIIAQQAGKEQQVTAQIFDSIHQKKAELSDIKDVKKLLELNGISEKDFDQSMSSMLVIAAEQKMQEQQELFGKLGALSGVPTFIVNDKYKINMREVKSQADLEALVKYLLAK